MFLESLGEFMKITKGKIILAVIVIYFIVMGVINISKEKDDNSVLLDQVTIVSDGKINSKNEDRLVLVTGKISFDGKISFLENGDSFNTFKAKRIVEDYKEIISSSGSKKNEWVERKDGFDSKEYLYTIRTETRTLDTMIGDFKLDKIGMDKVEASELYINRKNLIGDLGFDGLYYSNLDHEDNPQIGDMRIKYYYFNFDKNNYISILAKQKGNSFVPYELNEKKEIYNVYNGKIDNKEKLEEKLNEKTKSNIKGKILFVLMILGIGIFFIIDNKKKN